MPYLVHGCSQAAKCKFDTLLNCSTKQTAMPGHAPTTMASNLLIAFVFPSICIETNWREHTPVKTVNMFKLLLDGHFELNLLGGLCPAITFVILLIQTLKECFQQTEIWTVRFGVRLHYVLVSCHTLFWPTATSEWQSLVKRTLCSPGLPGILLCA